MIAVEATRSASQRVSERAGWLCWAHGYALRFGLYCAVLSYESMNRIRYPMKLFRVLPVVAVLALAGCDRAHAPKRPDAVPVSAVWAGGVDGGVFIDCAPSLKGEPNPCTVYNDGTGDVEMSGKFTLKGQTRGAASDELRYAFADGESVGLQGGSELIPLPAQRPASVPKSALLAENGVYLDCDARSESKVHRCSLFLSANGEKFFSGSYVCDESLPPCEPPDPKIADRSEIYLKNAGVLELAP